MPLVEPLGQIVRRVTRTIVAEQPWPGAMLSRCFAERPQRVLQTLGQGDEALAPGLVVTSGGLAVSFGRRQRGRDLPPWLTSIGSLFRFCGEKSHLPSLADRYWLCSSRPGE